jgi:hypothetical protein
MKFILIILIILTIFCLTAFAQVPLNPAAVTVASLPSASLNKGKVYVVNNGTSPGDCTVGGGSARTWCISSGSAWIALGDGLGTGGGAVNSFNGRSGTVLPVSGDYVKGDVGLGNVDNTSDAGKPVSTAQQAALDLKANLASPVFTGTPTLPPGTIQTGSNLFTAIAAPGTPAAGKGSVYVDSTSKNLAVKDDAGVVKHGVQTKAAVSNSFLTAINDVGLVTVAQPAFTDISGSIAASQMPALTGDVTTPAGAVATTIGANKVTLANMATMATASLLGRNTAGTGNVEVLSASTAKTLLSLNLVENTALSTWAGTANITTLGTISTGTWSGTAIGVTKGGTGTTTQFTTGSVVFAGASGVYSQDNANFFWDATNHRLGAGTTGPSYRVDVQGSATDYEGLRILNTNNSGATATTSGILLGISNSVGVINTKIAAVENDSGGISSHTDGAKADLAFYTTNGTGGTPTEVFRIAASGNVGIGLGNPSAQLHTTGTVRFANFGAGTATFDASGNISSVSDERLKRDIRPFTRGLDDLLGINPILYGYTVASGLDQTRNDYAGFSAQNVLLRIPEAIGYSPDGMMSFNDRPIIAALVTAVKELNARILAQQKQIDELLKGKQ